METFIAIIWLQSMKPFYYTDHLKEVLTVWKALEQAKKDYAEGEADPETFKTTIKGKDGKPQTVTRRDVAKFEEKMKKLQENVDLHEKNIQLLQKELAGTH